MIEEAHERFSRAQWAALGPQGSPATSARELGELSGLEPVALDEVRDVYLPLAQVLQVRRGDVRTLQQTTVSSFDAVARPVPFVIGIAGPVAVGKSVFARVLASLLARAADHPRIEVVATDGFLHPNAELERRGLAMRKGYPQTYDTRRLVAFLAAVKRAEDVIDAPSYSHVTYDVVPGATRRIERPDILVLEGINVLQRGEVAHGDPIPSDYVDVSLYLDADEDTVRAWYIERFLALRADAERDEESFFGRFRSLSVAQARDVAAQVWDSVNGPNLRENIVATRDRADVVVHKSADHRVDWLSLRRA